MHQASFSNRGKRPSRKWPVGTYVLGFKRTECCGGGGGGGGGGDQADLLLCKARTYSMLIIIYIM